VGVAVAADMVVAQTVRAEVEAVDCSIVAADNTVEAADYWVVRNGLVPTFD
jgi:hypothetical protein